MINYNFDVLGQNVTIKIRKDLKVMADDIDYVEKIVEAGIQRIVWNGLLIRKDMYEVELMYDINLIFNTFSKELVIDWDADIEAQVITFSKMYANEFSLKMYRDCVRIAKNK